MPVTRINWQVSLLDRKSVGRARRCYGFWRLFIVQGTLHRVRKGMVNKQPWLMCGIPRATVSSRFLTTGVFDRCTNNCTLSSGTSELSCYSHEWFIWQIVVFSDTCRMFLNLQAPCVLCIGQDFSCSPENAFYIFNQQIYFIIWYLLDRASLI